MATRKAAAAASVALPRRASIRQALDRRALVCMAAWPTGPHNAYHYQPFPVVRSAYVAVKFRIATHNQNAANLPGSSLGISIAELLYRSKPRTVHNNNLIVKSYAHEHEGQGNNQYSRGDCDKKGPQVAVTLQLHCCWFTITLADLCSCNAHHVRAAVAVATFRPAGRSSSRVEGQIWQDAQSVSYFRKQGCGVVDTWTAMLPKSSQHLCQFGSRRFSSGTLQIAFSMLAIKSYYIGKVPVH